ncbi:TetR/AcrR family transcriptional regulator [Streptomyces verrucosisporus]|uniref:ScbR family autoregulator-binding transcription factor n=1 Tax=Streptomyces verrucosisporus TaxID=1695161 RepID=UPI0019D038C8|nr:ScbR family autoregulator-binding transcription factor [Streptomyces verrucosisporus]MBN3932816.1 TetR/AcrR family transcriptional regulator [Streptomyces verrucosisporus]
MVKQERALRTRAAVLRAAAEAFDHGGYEGASLSQVSKAAGMSVGALTFHFSTKADLADAVMEEGWAAVQAVLERVAGERTPALRAIIDITLELARLMEENVAVRSAIRLTRERPTASTWSDSWLPTVRKLLDEAHRSGQLREDALPADVATLVEHLTSGAEAYTRERSGTGPGRSTGHQSAAGRLERVWHLVLTGVRAPEATAP